MAAASTDAAANGLNTDAKLRCNGSQANSADFVGSADGRTSCWMDCRPTDRLAALGALGLGPRHACQHALANDRALELGKHTKHLKHRLASRRDPVEALLMQVQIDPERVQLGEEGDEVLQAAASGREVSSLIHGW